MKNRVHNSPNLIYSVGTQVVALKQVQGSNGQTVHPPGAVGVIVRSPRDRAHSYRVKFVDGFEAAIHHNNLMLLAEYKQGAINDSGQVLSTHGLFDRVIYRCVVGSRAFGLDTDSSDTDRRGIYLPPADLHWSLYGVPEQLENDETEEAYWELQKFLIMALKGNPNILECLYTPIVEHVTPLAQELLDMRDSFLSRLVYQTFNGYVMSQFKRMQAGLRNQGKVKPKHVMHLMRLLLSGIHVLREGTVRVDVGEHREQLLAIKSGELTWEDVEAWRMQLHKDFDQALEETSLPERPDYECANDFLVRARRLAIAEELP
ncbi:MAG: nucleotidyltransferase domain-containing protein [Planctomycetota bacterium]|nr:MAG: nucleotidyltransferase domain-containing protein [Planctomycetota bacterium]REJ86930.1 MAG: nucleotidyltransferase domain-containing protein [Planctomycetota bacterium]REK24943.1 MAG: nucleotidyltransferase domain-containing protein [Planctomycetota bacterium]REK48532.1 MAG: nucleotidyltransferase domain-containing protein [Planctomycetota bacterium]